MPPGLSVQPDPARLLHEQSDEQLLHLVEVVGRVLVEDDHIRPQALDAASIPARCSSWRASGDVVRAR